MSQCVVFVVNNLTELFLDENGSYEKKPSSYESRERSPEIGRDNISKANEVGLPLRTNSFLRVQVDRRESR